MSDSLSWFKALADPTRLRVLATLSHGDLSVTDLTMVLRQSQPRVSRHLKLMTDAGLIERFKEGAWVFYRLADQSDAGRFIAAVLPHLDVSQGEFARDAERLAALRNERAEEAERYFADHAGDWDALRDLHGADAPVEAAVRAALAGRRIDTLLDIGTGTGRMLEVMTGSYERGIGVDRSRAMLAVARARLTAGGYDQCQVRLGDMYALPMADGEADAAILHQVLHFAEDPAAAIREAARALAPAGRLLVVDLAPHDREDLRTLHAHRRLGFTDATISGWQQAAGLTPAAPVHIDGGNLTVAVWAADKTGTHA